MIWQEFPWHSLILAVLGASTWVYSFATSITNKHWIVLIWISHAKNTLGKIHFNSYFIIWLEIVSEFLKEANLFESFQLNIFILQFTLWLNIIIIFLILYHWFQIRIANIDQYLYFQVTHCNRTVLEYMIKYVLWYELQFSLLASMHHADGL